MLTEKLKKKKKKKKKKMKKGRGMSITLAEEQKGLYISITFQDNMKDT